LGRLQVDDPLELRPLIHEEIGLLRTVQIF
jgi:hypothetical protein